MSILAKAPQPGFFRPLIAHGLGKILSDLAELIERLARAIGCSELKCDTDDPISTRRRAHYQRGCVQGTFSVLVVDDHDEDQRGGYPAGGDHIDHPGPQLQTMPPVSRQLGPHELLLPPGPGPCRRAFATLR